MSDPAELVKLIAIELGLRPTASGDEILTELRRLRSAVMPPDDEPSEGEPAPEPLPVAAPSHIEALLTVEECQGVHDAVRLLSDTIEHWDGGHPWAPESECRRVYALLIAIASRLPGAAQSEAA